jgi:regulator of protease activity HflC (stomatin/prohibitin superfamily)
VVFLGESALIFYLSFIFYLLVVLNIIFKVLIRILIIRLIKKRGIKVERVELKDVRLPQSMQRAMATEAEASREARAKVIAAEGDQKASIALKEAADMINQSPVALQLRYLQTLGSIAAEKNSTIVFPIPMEMLRHFSTGK